MLYDKKEGCKEKIFLFPVKKMVKGFYRMLLIKIKLMGERRL